VLARFAPARCGHTARVESVDARRRLELLALERTAALSSPLRADAHYMADLEDEIATTRHAYVGSAVVEIAVLRAGLGQRGQG